MCTHTVYTAGGRRQSLHHTSYGPPVPEARHDSTIRFALVTLLGAFGWLAFIGQVVS